MPRGDGTGPAGAGSAQGQGKGRGRNQGAKPGSGPGGNCVCPNCNNKVPHQAGQPCYEVSCPECGTRMTKA